MLKEIPSVLEKLTWMRKNQIWPNGQRYLWTDAFGVVLLVSLYQELQEDIFLEQAEWVVAEVDRVLGRAKGIRIGEAPDRDGQYFHYLAMWLYALHTLGKFKPTYQEKAISLVQEVHPHFVRPKIGVYWKMEEDLSAPYPGYGFGLLDPYHGYVVYRALAPDALKAEIEEMRALIEKTYLSLEITQDLGVGMMLWMTHFFPEEDWAQLQRSRGLATLDRLWIDPPGYFCRQPSLPDTRFAFTNYGISLGLQAVDQQLDRVEQVNQYFAGYQSGDRYDVDAITHVMSCTSHFPGDLIQG